MTDDGTDALEQALALRAAPARLSVLRARPLPASVLLLLQIAAGHEESIVRSARRTSETARAVVDAATLYVQQVLFDERADCYRVLGVNPDAGIETIREHYRWMMRWLHPDRHGERWETVYTERVNAAWNALRQEERRGAYDRQRLPAATMSSAVPSTPERARTRPIVIAENTGPRASALLSPWVYRHLPALVLGGLAASAIVVVGLVYWNEPAVLPDAPAPVAMEASRTEGDTPQDVALRRALADNDPSFESQLAAESPTSEVASGESAVASGEARKLPEVATPKPTPAIETPIASIRATEGAGAPHGNAGDHPAGKATAGSTDAPARPMLAAAAAAEPPARSHADRHAAVPEAVTARSRPIPIAAGAEVLAKSPAEAATGAPLSYVPKRGGDRRVGASDPSAGVTATADGNQRPAKAEPIVAPTRSQDPLSAEREGPAGTVSRAFIAAYGRGDLPEMMQLFAPDAVENRGGIDAIAEDYGNLFRNTSSRELNLDGVHWSAQPMRIVGMGNFEARVWLRNGRAAKRVVGWIEIEAVLVGREWKIKSLLHGNRE